MSVVTASKANQQPSDAPRVHNPGAGLSPEAFIEKIIALRPMIRDQQEAADANGGYVKEVHEALLDFGAYFALNPKRYNGHEFDVATFLRASIEMSRSDPGSGWCYTFATGHVPMIAGHYPQEAQDEIFTRHGGLALAPLRAPTGGTIRKVDGGYVCNGKWDWGSGMSYATHVMPTARLVEDGVAGPPTFFVPLIPIENITVLWDSWGNGNSMGLNASGSHTFVVDNVFVPENMCTPFQAFQRAGESPEGTFGTRLHGNSLYLGLTTSYFTSTIASVMVGCAWAALDEFEHVLRTKKTINPPFGYRMHSPDYQQPFGDALMYAKAADACIMEYARQYQKLLKDWENGIPLTAEADFALGALCTNAARLASKSVEVAFYAGGSSSAMKGGRLNRYFRDMATYRTHPIAQYHTAAIGFAQGYLGLPVPLLETVGGGKRS
ncbi:3-hydroxy-9,10-secoandrosta-1,3,5(10)-triene-9,17-dione monooxygenase [Nitrospirillum viridazoti]|uniref:3-hydroxy-9,10-secoandrosta-1,3,5(10)-triene-9, 17-dione monooxygenase n=1 Tax=Nitrospirillum amazonense TaxID=28077 RepID=A0A560HK39_9PROT|nr:3-hydroxy-9,10-secoandrosta-1,3,5(10)-triene-9,17-dione monooxygenase [Nitrospirillum amazonense]